MKTLVNTNPLGDVDFPLLGRTLRAGEEFTVDDDTADALLLQVGNFALADEPKTRKHKTQEN